MSKNTSQNISLVIIVAVCIGLICIFQGGYFALPVFIISAALCFVYFVLSVFGSLKPKISVVVPLLIALSVVYFVSAAINSMNLTAFICACVPAVLAVSSLAFATFNSAKSCLMYRIIALLGVALATVSIIGFIAFPNVEMFCMSSRLVFPLGYSNASGIFFMVVAVLCVFVLKGKFKLLFVLPVTALLLTKSVGAIVISVFVAIIIWAYWLKNFKAENKLKIISLVIVLVCVALFVVLAIVWSDRITEASQTFIERYIQVCDGFTLLASSPLFGVGPDQWQFLYSAIQTAQYTASKIHCSYMQVLLDGGIVAAVVVFAAIICAYVRLIQEKANVSIMLITALLFHALIDFDFSFPLVCILLILLFECPIQVYCKDGNFEFIFCEANHQKELKIPTIICCVICCLISFAGFFFQMQMNGVANVANNVGQSQNYANISNKLISNDPKANAYIMSGLVNGKQFQEACNYTQNLEHQSTSCIVLTIRAIAGIGNSRQAISYMQTALDAHPYNADLYNMVHDLLQNNDFNQDYKDSYNESALKAIEKFDIGNSALLSEHKFPELF